MRSRLLLLVLAILATGCSPMYVLRAGIEEARILGRRRPITEVIRDADTDSVTRRKLELVLQARDYSKRVLRLDAGESYTTYSYVDSDTLLLVVSGSRRDRFEAYTWWFPIVGRVPYKGFFEFEDAFEEAEELEADGYDSYVRPSGAFSTLGWFNDPLLNTVLRYDDISLAGTVIHEILHNSIYIPSQVSFNESFANFVGERGVAEFFCTRDGEASPRCRQAQDNWQDNLRFAAFLSALVADLEAIYQRTDIDTARKLELREEVFRSARQNFTEVLEPQLRTNAYRGFTRRPMNNATLIGTRLYYDRLAVFEAVYQSMNRDFVGAVHAIMNAARASPNDPFGATAALITR
jgi:predicted aminopeptidase